MPQDIDNFPVSAGKSAAGAAQSALEVIQTTPFEAEALETALRALADGLGISAGQLFTILREAITGQRVSPPLLETMEIVGLPKVEQRIERAIQLLGAQDG